MTEIAAEYRSGTCHYWVCEGCGHELAVVTDGEAWFDGKVRMNGHRVLVLCPVCGRWNVWALDSCKKA